MRQVKHGYLLLSIQGLATMAFGTGIVVYTILVDPKGWPFVVLILLAVWAWVMIPLFKKEKSK